MIHLQNTLYAITPQAYVHLDNAALRVDMERERRLQVPLHHVGALVCFGSAMPRLAQPRAIQNPAVTLELARPCVAGNIRNSRSLVQRGAREADDHEDATLLDRAAAKCSATRWSANCCQKPTTPRTTTLLRR